MPRITSDVSIDRVVKSVLVSANAFWVDSGIEGIMALAAAATLSEKSGNPAVA